MLDAVLVAQWAGVLDCVYLVYSVAASPAAWLADAETMCCADPAVH